MSTSLWAAPAEELRRRTASADPTPGGGSVAAIAGALGVGLVQMAVAVTDDPALAERAERLERVQALVVPAADEDVAVFDTLMAAYRLPRTDGTARETRATEIVRATIVATERPLVLAETLAEAARVAAELEPLVKRGIVSDVLAGGDLIVGAARAAVRTVDLNLAALDRASLDASGRKVVAGLRARRDAVWSALSAIPASAEPGGRA